MSVFVESQQEVYQLQIHVGASKLSQQTEQSFTLS